MKKSFPKSIITIIGITLILTILLIKRLYTKDFNADSILIFLAGIALFFILLLVLRIDLKQKK